MSKIPSPAEIRRTKQAIASAKLIAWAQAWGFETKRQRSGGSHIHCKHSEYPDITFGIVADSDDIAYRKDLATAIEAVQVRRNEACQSFAISAQNNICTAFASLPDYMEVDHDFEKGQSIVRDKNIPQIGFTLPFTQSHLLENKVRYLETLKRDVYQALGRAESEHDIKHPFKNGVLQDSLSHGIYDIPEMVLPKYKAGEKPDGLLENIYAYVACIGVIDADHKARLDKILGSDIISQKLTICSSRRGERHHKIIVDIGTKPPIRVSFETASNQRVDHQYFGRISNDALSKLESTMAGISRKAAKIIEGRLALSA